MNVIIFGCGNTTRKLGGKLTFYFVFYLLLLSTYNYTDFISLTNRSSAKILGVVGMECGHNHELLTSLPFGQIILYYQIVTKFWLMLENIFIFISWS